MRSVCRGVKLLGCAIVVLAASLSAFAEAAAPGATGRNENLGQSVLSTTIFGLVGIVMAILGFKLFDLVTRFHVEKEIYEKQNVAAAVVAAAMILGICIIVAAAVI